jgi:glycosyltransferase involved in cell wall biosynthesis
MNILLVIPAFNEEPTIPGLIESAKPYIRDIMVIDDGSSDATTLVSVMTGAMTHRFAENKGKGEALKTAFEYAVGQGYDWVFTMDGNGRHDPADLPKFFPLLGAYDLVLGYRTQDAGSKSIIRRFGNTLASVLLLIFCGRWIADCQTGYRAYSVELLRSIQLNSSRYDLETEALIKSIKKGLRVGQVTVQVVNSPQHSRFRPVRDSLAFLRVIVKSVFRR